MLAWFCVLREAFLGPLAHSMKDPTLFVLGPWTPVAPPFQLILLWELLLEPVEGARGPDRGEIVTMHDAQDAFLLAPEYSR